MSKYKRLKETGPNEKVSASEKYVKEFFKQHGEVKISDIIKESSYSQAAIRRFLMKLIEEGTIVVEKNNSNKVYRINKEG